jgi:hypothetical protein
MPTSLTLPDTAAFNHSCEYGNVLIVHSFPLHRVTIFVERKKGTLEGWMTEAPRYEGPKAQSLQIRGSGGAP